MSQLQRYNVKDKPFWPIFDSLLNWSMGYWQNSWILIEILLHQGRGVPLAIVRLYQFLCLSLPFLLILSHLFYHPLSFPPLFFILDHRMFSFPFRLSILVQTPDPSYSNKMWLKNFRNFLSDESHHKISRRNKFGEKIEICFAETWRETSCVFSQRQPRGNRNKTEKRKKGK